MTSALVSEGASVVAASRNLTDELSQLTSQCEVYPVQVDLGTLDGPARLIDESICVPGREVNNDKVVRRLYEDLLRDGEVKPDLLQQRYGAYDPSPVVSSRICLASSTNEAGTSTSLGPADRKSGASKPAARWISEGIPASFSTPSISSATDSSGAAATFTHLSSMRAFYPDV